MTATYLSVEPHMVEYGDVIFGLTSPVASILTDGAFWWYGDDRGTFIAKRPSWGHVQVIRGQAPQDVVEGKEARPCRHGDLPSTTTSPGPCSPDDSRVADGPPVSPASTDWCDPHGITRGPGGLYVVVP